jgi:hypoxanthine-DNA glycosylase
LEKEHVQHTFEPVYDDNSQILILGTFPSVKSREQHFYYGHPQNRFWKVIAEITGDMVPGTIEEKKQLLLKNSIAVWDVIQSCDITGSSDSSIRNVVPNDIPGLLAKTNIKVIAANGAKAAALYNKYILEKTGLPIVTMPSTSPANAAWTLTRLCEQYRKIFEDI